LKCLGRAEEWRTAAGVRQNDLAAEPALRCPRVLPVLDRARWNLSSKQRPGYCHRLRTGLAIETAWLQTASRVSRVLLVLLFLFGRHRLRHPARGPSRRRRGCVGPGLCCCTTAGAACAASLSRDAYCRARQRYGRGGND